MFLHNWSELIIPLTSDYSSSSCFRYIVLYHYRVLVLVLDVYGAKGLCYLDQRAVSPGEMPFWPGESVSVVLTSRD